MTRHEEFRHQDRHARLFELIRQGNVILDDKPADNAEPLNLHQMQRFLNRADRSFTPERKGRKPV